MKLEIQIYWKLSCHLDCKKFISQSGLMTKKVTDSFETHIPPIGLFSPKIWYRWQLNFLIQIQHLLTYCANKKMFSKTQIFIGIFFTIEKYTNCELFEKYRILLGLNDMNKIFEYKFSTILLETDHQSHQLRTNNHLEQQQQHQVDVLSSEPPVIEYKIVNCVSEKVTLAAIFSLYLRPFIFFGIISFNVI